MLPARRRRSRRINALVGLPRRAREWRAARRDRSGQAALREALAQYFGGRYTRAQKSAQRALVIQADTPELAQDNEFTVLGHLLAAGSAHRLQDRALRDEELRQRARAVAAAARRRGRPRRAPACLPPNGRSTTATRRARSSCSASCRSASRDALTRCACKLQAARLGRQPQEALKTARLLPSTRASRRSPRPACCARSRSSRSTPSHDIDQLRRALALRSMPPTVAIPSSPRARRRRRRRARRERGCARLAAAALGPLAELGIEERAAVAEALAAPPPASAPSGCRGSSPRPRRCRAKGRSRWPRAARWPSAACGARRGRCSSGPPTMRRSRRRCAARPGSGLPSSPRRRATRPVRPAARNRGAPVG